MSHKDIGSEIRKRRRLLGLTQVTTAELAGVGRRTLVDLESGRGSRGATLEKVRAICSVLGLELIVIDAQTLAEYDQP